MIPMVMRLRYREVKDGRRTGVNLWLPLFLIWILLLPVILILLIVWGLLRLAGPVSPDALNAARLMEAGVKILTILDELRIDIRSKESRFILHF